MDSFYTSHAMKRVVEVLITFSRWILVGTSIFIALIWTCTATARQPKTGFPVQRADLYSLTCTIIKDRNDVRFLIIGTHERDMTSEKITSCLNQAKKNRFTLAQRKELNLYSPGNSYVAEVRCLFTQEYVISFSNEIPNNLTEKASICLRRARLIYNIKRDDPSWI